MYSSTYLRERGHLENRPGVDVRGWLTQDRESEAEKRKKNGGEIPTAFARGFLATPEPPCTPLFRPSNLSNSPS